MPKARAMLIRVEILKLWLPCSMLRRCTGWMPALPASSCRERPCCSRSSWILFPIFTGSAPSRSRREGLLRDGGTRLRVRRLALMETSPAAAILIERGRALFQRNLGHVVMGGAPACGRFRLPAPDDIPPTSPLVQPPWSDLRLGVLHLEARRENTLHLSYWQMQDPVSVRKKLGQRIRHLRGKRGWSQERLAHEAGLGRSFTGAIERGEKDIRIKTLCKVAGILEINLSYLFKGTDEGAVGKKR